MNLWRLPTIEGSILIYRWKEDNMCQSIWDKIEVPLGTLRFDPLPAPSKQITKKKAYHGKSLSTPNSTWGKKVPFPSTHFTPWHDFSLSVYLSKFDISLSNNYFIFKNWFRHKKKYFWIFDKNLLNFDIIKHPTQVLVLESSPARGIALTTGIPSGFEKKSFF
jgi:hypothetical protein